MKKLFKVGSLICGLAALLAAPSSKATPYASCITNTAGTISFYLNEAGANVTVTYEDNSTNGNYNGVTTGTNLATGVHTFVLTGHTSYAISVTKPNPSIGVIDSVGRSSARGVDVNKNPTSPYFGNVYSVQSASTNIFQLNSDLSQIRVKSGGVAWSTGSALSPYRIGVASDDFLMVGDSSAAHAGAWRLAPDLSSNQLFLGPVGESAGLAAGSFGTVQSRPLLIGTVANGNAQLMQIDGDLATGGNYNQILIYNINSGPLPWTNPPTVFGPEVGINLTSEPLGDNEYPGLTQGPDGKIYASTYRNDLSRPNVQVYDSTGTNLLWNSWEPDGTAYPGGSPSDDYFRQTVAGFQQGTVDSAVSPDGKYLVGVSIDNWFVVTPLTNGIPDPSRLFIIQPTSFTGNARGLAFDAADNVYLSSSGIGAVQEWSLGLSATAITTGNASGTTGFQLILPSTTASVIPSVNTFASQGGNNGVPGTPVSSSFTVTRFSTNGYALPLLVNFSLTGTAPAAAYTISSPDGTIAPGSNGVVIAAGQTNATVVVTPTTNNVPRLTTSVILNLVGGGSYQIVAPFSDTNFIQNTSTQLVQISAVSNLTSMYRGISNDFTTLVLQRLGDTNAPAYTLSPFILSGTAVGGTDYTIPAPPTINPGDVTITVTNFPLVAGAQPVHDNGLAFVGDKTFTIKVGAGSAYTTNATSTNFTILDNAYLPGTVLYTNALTDPNDATNWNITFGNGDPVNLPNDYEVDFGYDLVGDPQGGGTPIPPPPGGATTALRMTCNKASNPGAAGAVNVYLTNQAFSGDFSVRFNMNLVQGGNPSYTTEGVVFGINHGGTYSNWWYGSGPFPTNGMTWSSDGVWYYVTCDTGAANFGDDAVFTGNGGTNGNTGWAQPLPTKLASAFAGNFKRGGPGPGPYTATSAAGAPANGSTVNGLNDTTWSDVEIKQARNIITMSINKTVIFVHTNTTVWTNGFLMLGYEDPFGGTGGSSVGTPDAAVYYANLRVVGLTPPVFTKQPTNIVVAPAGSVTFSALATFPSTSISSNYQWTFNGAAIAGATGTSYTIASVAAANYGNYAVTVTDGNYTVTSTNGTLIPPLPTISTQPASRAAVVGSTPTFTVTASTSSGKTNYQWIYASTNIPAALGGTSKTLGLTNVQAGSFGAYSVSINDGFNTITSAPANLTLAGVPSFSQSLSNTTIRMTLSSEFGPSYIVQYKTNLNQAAWIGLSTNAGTGSPITVLDSTTTNQMRFYRVQVK